MSRPTTKRALWFTAASIGRDESRRLKIAARRQRRAQRRAIHDANHQRRLRARQLTAKFRK